MMRKIRICERNAGKIDYLFRSRGGVEGLDGGGYVLINNRISLHLNRIIHCYPAMRPGALDGCQSTLAFDTDIGGDDDFLAVIVKVEAKMIGYVTAWYLTDISTGDSPTSGETMILAPGAVADIVGRMVIGHRIASSEDVARAAINLRIGLHPSDMPFREAILHTLFADVLDNPTVESAVEGLMTWARLEHFHADCP